MKRTTTTLGALYAIPATLRATAAAWAVEMPTTQRDRQAAIRDIQNRAGLSLTAAREVCETAADAARAARRQRRSARRGTHGTPKAPKDHARMRHYGLDEALRRVRTAAVLAAYRSAYRTPSADHGDETVRLTSDPATVGISQNKSTNWDLYRGAYKGWAANVIDTIITVPNDWRIRVQRHGLAVVDGMMTLDASRLEGAPEGVRLYAATWIVQGRGYAVTATTGYIATTGEITYHADSAVKALAGLRRKIAGAEWAAKLAACDLSSILSGGIDLDGATVRISDARAIGACDYGIRSWCHATGLPYDAGQASLRQVWAAYQAQPRTEARAAILHALRRQRRLAA